MLVDNPPQGVIVDAEQLVGGLLAQLSDVGAQDGRTQRRSELHFVMLLPTAEFV
jgi:hypothetical protein